jgi:hypothetical protein
MQRHGRLPFVARIVAGLREGSKVLLFLKKKKQKDFPLCAVANPQANGQKFFGSFFQKRTTLTFA